MALQDEILAQSAQIKTDSYQMSIGELLNLYRDRELDVHPEFQRVFRWSDTQKTKLIESILLGIPMPPIFVAQRLDGVWDVVDGVQRLSTIFQFAGVLRDENDEVIPPLVLEKTKFLPSLEGQTWSGAAGFSKQQQLYIRRAKIDVKIVLKESDEKSKYELFMRLNTGGSTLTSQEVRNCLMLMAYPESYEWIRTLSLNQDFDSTVALTDKDRQEQYPMDLVTRFLTFRKLPQEALTEVEDINEYLDESLEALHRIAKDETRRAVEGVVFSATFRVLNATMQEDAFRRYSESKGKFSGPFSLASFEVVAMGIGFNMSDSGALPVAEDVLADRIRSVWGSPTFIKYSGSGVRASARIPRIIPLGRELFSK